MAEKCFISCHSLKRGDFLASFFEKKLPNLYANNLGIYNFGRRSYKINMRGRRRVQENQSVFPKLRQFFDLKLHAVGLGKFLMNKIRNSLTRNSPNGSQKNWEPAKNGRGGVQTLCVAHIAQGCLKGVPRTSGCPIA